MEWNYLRSPQGNHVYPYLVHEALFRTISRHYDNLLIRNIHSYLFQSNVGYKVCIYRTRKDVYDFKTGEYNIITNRAICINETNATNGVGTSILHDTYTADGTFYHAFKAHQVQCLVNDIFARGQNHEKKHHPPLPIASAFQVSCSMGYLYCDYVDPQHRPNKQCTHPSLQHEFCLNILSHLREPLY